VRTRDIKDEKTFTAAGWQLPDFSSPAFTGVGDEVQWKAP
jgi:hypothetical protein